MSWKTIVLVSVMLGAALQAQDSRGLIAGRVLDPAGAGVPAAEVKATNLATNVVSTATATAQGNYEIRFLQPGAYSLETIVPGFKTYVRSGIEVRVGDRITLDLTLELGNLTDRVTVTAEAPPLEAGTATLGSVMDVRRIESMPIHGGNTFSLARLAAGISSFVAPNLPTELSATNVVSWFGVNGTPQQSSEFTIDGTSSMSGRMPSYTPPPDLVAEFRIQTATYDASVGRTAGGAINVALKSGTNKLHGTLYELHNDAHLQSMDLFQRQFLYNAATGPVTDDKRKQAYPYNVFNRFGGSLSGPWLVPKLYNGRNKTFWIFGYEGYRRVRNESGSSVFTVPTAEERAGNFARLLALGASYQIYDPATAVTAANGRISRQPLAGNVVPASRISPIARKILDYWPSPNTQGTADGLNNFYRPRRSWDQFGTYNGRVDHNPTERYRIFGRYYKTAQVWTGGARVFDNPVTGALLHRDSQGGGLDQVYTFTPRLLLNVRYSFARYIQLNQPYSSGYDLAGLGLPSSLVSQIDPAAIQFPNITVDSFQALGNGANNRSVTNYHVVAGDLTWTHSSHSLHFGGEQRIYREHNYNFAAGSPALGFDSTYTKGPLDTAAGAPIGQGLAALLLGLPSNGGITLNDSGAEQSFASSLFVQDDWRITRRLTLNFGLRWDYDAPITERFNRSVRSFAFDTASPLEAQAKANYARSPMPEIPAAQFRVVGGLTFPGVGGQPRTLWKAPNHNLSPRAGFAYQLTPKTVIRSGYGIFFVPAGSDRSSVNQLGFSLRNTLVASLDNGLSFAATLANPFPDPLKRPAGVSAGLLTNAGQAVSFFEENLRTGYMQRWSFNVQRQLPHQFVTDVSYVGNRGTKLDSSTALDALPVQYLSRSSVRDQATIDYLNTKFANPFYPLLPGTNLAAATVNRSQLLLPYPQFSGMTVTRPLGYSWYHSLQSSLQRRFSRGVTINANYTWSKYMSATGYLNPGDAYTEKTIDAEDRQHRFTATGIWQLPFGQGGRSAVNKLAGGWSLQFVWQTNTGAPMSFANPLFTGDVTQIALPKSERTLSPWFNTSGFAREASRQLASNYRSFSTRSSGVRGPGINNADISLFKRVPLRERLALQIRGEFLNAFNRTHFTDPATAPTSTLFGAITASYGYTRQVHLTLRLEF